MRQRVDHHAGRRVDRSLWVHRDLVEVGVSAEAIGGLEASSAPPIFDAVNQGLEVSAHVSGVDCSAWQVPIAQALAWGDDAAFDALLNGMAHIHRVEAAIRYVAVR